MSEFNLVFLYDENQKIQCWSPWENQSLLPRGKGTHYIHLLLNGSVSTQQRLRMTAVLWEALESTPLRSCSLECPLFIRHPESCFSGCAEAFSFPTWLLNTVCQWWQTWALMHVCVGTCVSKHSACLGCMVISSKPWLEGERCQTSPLQGYCCPELLLMEPDEPQNASIQVFNSFIHSTWRLRDFLYHSTLPERSTNTKSLLRALQVLHALHARLEAQSSRHSRNPTARSFLLHSCKLQIKGGVTSLPLRASLAGPR